MNRVAKITLVIALLVFSLLSVAYLYQTQVVNPRVLTELHENPTGPRALRAMLLTISEDQTYPVNYLRENELVFAGIDGGWWRDIKPTGHPVSMLIQGKTYSGTAIVVLDDPEYTAAVFDRLRPKAPKWLPSWLNGKLVVITLAGSN